MIAGGWVSDGIGLAILLMTVLIQKRLITHKSVVRGAD